jgi:hypothetical protein
MSAFDRIDAMRLEGPGDRIYLRKSFAHISRVRWILFEDMPKWVREFNAFPGRVKQTHPNRYYTFIDWLKKYYWRAYKRIQDEWPYLTRSQYQAKMRHRIGRGYYDRGITI